MNEDLNCFFVIFDDYMITSKSEVVYHGFINSTFIV